MATYFAVAFNSSNPSSYPSLAPTFITFKRLIDQTNVTPPGITQLGTTGVYYFLYGVTTPTYFLLDGITTSTSSDRYVYGILDPVQQVDIPISFLQAQATTLSAQNNTITAQGTTITAQSNTMSGQMVTLAAIGSSLSTLDVRIGSTLSSIGSTSVDPGDLFGYLKRAQEFREGQQTFNKVSGAWDIKTRGGTLLVERVLTNSSTQVNRS